MDHNPPVLEMILPFCKSVEEWVNQGEKFITAIHCKAGKGRTGCLICCWMLYNRDFETANESMNYYAQIRTKNNKGVTIPSQRRYIRYFEEIVNKGMRPLYQVSFSRLIAGPFSKAPKKGIEMLYHFKIHFEGKDKIYESKSKENVIAVSFNKEKMLTFIVAKPIPLIGDIRIQFYKKNKKVFQLWFHSSYIADGTQFFKPDLDSACKNKKIKSDFSAQLFFSETNATPQVGVCGFKENSKSNARVYFQDDYKPGKNKNKNINKNSNSSSSDQPENEKEKEKEKENELETEENNISKSSSSKKLKNNQKNYVSSSSTSGSEKSD
ncbi:phosphatase with homology to tensin [Anaeramoeba flamelloides]|uniref:Phosphatidylinositol 3,4,5-trisphosphate 3-phosphatase and dual-specificity protein phosphatase PTEN n=1 Tax=Anaeramoeba flamelloides TaxID=1746091 RepID=A0ABQ8YM53_9EUKA|nr:phosphatase with homology to tensin [Anaeramoeba flamelloides]